MTNEQEIWREIEGYPDYRVSNLGRIQSCRKKPGEWRLITPAVTKDGYARVSLRNEVGKGKTLSVHRLVAKAFVPGYRDGLQVNHKDEDTLNNRADNLEWVTQRENNVFGTAIERRIARGQSKAVCQLDADGKLLAEYPSVKAAAESLGKKDGKTIVAVCNGKRSTAYGYQWRWKEQNSNNNKS